MRPSSDTQSTNLGYWARSAAANFGDRLAIIDWVGERQRTLTHTQLEARLERAASMFSAWGLPTGSRVAVGIGNRSEYIEVFFGAMRAGLVPVPLNLRQGRTHLAHVLADSGCAAAIIESGANEHLAPMIEGNKLSPRVAIGSPLPGWQDYETLMATASPVFKPIELPPDHPAILAYTSGSTGKAKGVVLTHTGQLWWIEKYRQLYQTDPAERSLVAVPLYHKNAMAGVVKTKLAAGASMVLMPKYDPRLFLENLSRFHCTHATGVPTIYSLALREQDLLKSLDFSSLRSLTVGSAPVHNELHKLMENSFGCRVFQSYGSTEGGPVVIGPPTDGRRVPLGSCGVLWPGCEAKLISSDGEIQANVGELWLRNPGVTPGYHNLPGVNSQRLKDGWFATGDLFEVDQAGFWYFRGRADDMFDCGGENVFPKEVEDLLLSHPAVLEACVVPIPHASKGQAPAALVVLNSVQSVTADELKQFCIKNGPAYAHPRLISFTGELPLNGAGKVDRTTVLTQMRNTLKEAPVS